MKAIIISIIFALFTLTSCVTTAPYSAHWDSTPLGEAIVMDRGKALTDLHNKYIRLMANIPIDADIDKDKATEAVNNCYTKLGQLPTITSAQDVTEASDSYVKACGVIKRISKKYGCFDKVFVEETNK